jgi:GNAT superfamily N-acetyltransferase
MHFDADYEEVIERDGVRYRLRPIRPSDRARLREGLARLSPLSRYRRFFSAKTRLSEAELSYLTELDGVHHFALVLGTIDERGEEVEGVGVARYVELPDRPGVAEPAIVVVDEHHGRGLGRLLMDRLISAAVERGMHAFRSEVLAQNRPMLEFLRTLNPDQTRENSGSVVTVQFELLPAPDTHDPAHPLRRTLRATAGGVAAVQGRLTADERWHSA